MSNGERSEILSSKLLRNMLHTKSLKTTSRRLSVNTINIADQRRVAKYRGNKDKVKKLSAELQCKARKYKERQLDEQCQHLEEANRKCYTSSMFAAMKMMQSSLRKGTVRDGNELIDQWEIKSKWRESTEELSASQTENQEEHENGQIDG